MKMGDSPRGTVTARSGQFGYTIRLSCCLKDLSSYTVGQIGCLTDLIPMFSFLRNRPFSESQFSKLNSNSDGDAARL